MGQSIETERSGSIRTAEPGPEAMAVLVEDGCVVLPDLLTASQVDDLRAELAPHLAACPPGRSTFEGLATRRVYGLVSKSRAFDDLVLAPAVLGLAEQVLGTSCLLSAALAIDIDPGETAQALHFDDAFYPLPRPRPASSVSVLWSLDDFEPENGATRVCAGSHLWGETQIGDDLPTDPLVMSAGSAFVYLGTLVHGGGANTTDSSRLAISFQYCAGWGRQQENFLLALGPERTRALPPRLQELVGISIHSLMMGMVDGRHPRKALYPD